MELGFWNAGVILCRKIIDIKTAKIWMEKYPTEQVPSKLKVRIDKLFPETDEIYGKSKVYHRAHVIRLDGNAAVHEDEILPEDSAVEILSFTKWFDNFTSKTSINCGIVRT